MCRKLCFWCGSIKAGASRCISISTYCQHEKQETMKICLSLICVTLWCGTHGAITSNLGPGLPLNTGYLNPDLSLNLPKIPPLPTFPEIRNMISLGYPHTPFHTPGSFSNSYNMSSGYTYYTNYSSFFHYTSKPLDHGFGQRVCPKQQQLPDVATYSGDPVGYPIDNITAELLTDVAFLQFLQREIVLPGAPSVPEDRVLLQASPSCKFLETRLWRFDRYNGRCWILQNFQEIVTFVTCLTKKCSNSYDFWNFSNYENRCLANYRFESVWAYCEALPPGERVVRERLLIPRSCTCQKIQCQGYFK